jgi:radical SAM enzyme (TIGR01210 family)
MLDEKTFSTTALMYLVAKMNTNHKHITIISLETRIEYVDFSELVILKRALNEGNSETELELGIGFEAYDDHIRNDLFNKGLTLEAFETFIKMVSEFNYSIKCYFMLKPVTGISNEDAIADIRKAICYLSFMANLHNIKINIHINLTYVAKGTKLVQAFENGEYIPPTLKDLANAIIIAKESDNPLFSIYLGLYDEGLAVEGGSFLRPGDEENLALLEQFNITQNFAYIEEVINS